MSLVSKTFSSVAWVAAKLGGRQIANVLLFFALAGFLPPGDVGIAALGANIAVLTIPAVTRGVRDFVIQADEVSQSTVNSAFAANLLIGGLLSFALAVTSPALSYLFHDDRLFGLALAVSPLPLIAAAGSVQEAIWERKLSYKKVSFVHLLGSAIGGVAALSLILLGKGIWSLVAFNLLAFFVSSIFLIVAHSAINPFKGTISGVVQVYRFAWPVMASQVLATGQLRIVETIIGIFLNPSVVAYFRLASNFIRLINQLLMAPISQVLLPIFSRSGSDSPQIFLKALTANAAVLSPAFLGMASIFPIVVELVFGPQWSPASEIGIVLCFGFLGPILLPVAYPFFISQNGGTTIIKLTVLEVLVCVVLVTAGSQFGAISAAFGFIARLLFLLPLASTILRRQYSISYRELTESVLPFALVSAIMFTLIRYLTTAFPIQSEAIFLLVIIPFGLIIYFVSALLLTRAIFPFQFAVLSSLLPSR